MVLIFACLCVCSTLRQRADPVYSPPLQISGLCWRLKVYPVSDTPTRANDTLSVSHSRPGLVHTEGNHILPHATARRRVWRVRSAAVPVHAGDCAGIPSVARAFQSGCAACRLHAPPSVNTRRLCCLEGSMAWIRWGQAHAGLRIVSWLHKGAAKGRKNWFKFSSQGEVSPLHSKFPELTCCYWCRSTLWTCCEGTDILLWNSGRVQIRLEKG